MTVFAAAAVFVTSEQLEFLAEHKMILFHENGEKSPEQKTHRGTKGSCQHFENGKESSTKCFPEVGSSSRICGTAGGMQGCRQGWGVVELGAGGSHAGGSLP